MRGWLKFALRFSPNAIQVAHDTAEVCKAMVGNGRVLMKRRSFLSLLASAAAAPALPLSGSTAAVSGAAYNRFTYGYAVFRARHGGAFGAADLASSLKVTAAQAQGMIAEMAQSGVVRSAANGAVEAVTTHGGQKGGLGFLRKTTKAANDLLDRVAELADADSISDEIEPENKSDGIPMEFRCNSDPEYSPNNESVNPSDADTQLNTSRPREA